MTYDKRLALATVLMVSMFAGPTAQARQDAVLPELAPREVEITGDLTIVFPALRRQPLVGFNPPPPVPDISRSRLPFAEAYKQPSADLPPSPVQPPEPPDVNAMAQRAPMQGMLTATVGRYLDRKLVANLALRYSQKTAALFDLEYHGSQGHEPFSGSTASSEFEKLQSSLMLTRRTGPVVLSTRLSGFKRTYSLFGLTPDAGEQSQANPDRDFSAADASIGIGTAPGSRWIASLDITGGVSSVETDVFDPNVRVDPSSRREEKFLTTDARLSIPIQDGSIAITGAGSTSGLDESSFPGTMMQSGYSQVLVSYLYSRNLNLKAGVAVFGFRSEKQRSSDRKRSLAYLSPVAEASYTLSSSLRVFAGNQPSLDPGLQRNAYSTAPFMMDEPLLLPTMTSINAHGGAEYLSEFITTKIQAGYKELPFQRFAFASSTPTHGYSAGYPAFGYDESNLMYGRADLGVMLSPGLQLGIDAEYRKSEITAQKAEIPYFSPLVLGGFASASFLNGNAQVQLNFRHESSRPVDLAGVTETGSITLFGAEGSYFLTSTYGLTVGIRNLGASPEFWQLYPLESSTVYFGAKYRW